MTRYDATHYIEGSAQDCGNSIANTLGLLQSCTKPSKDTDCIERDSDKGKTLNSQKTPVAPLLTWFNFNARMDE